MQLKLPEFSKTTFIDYNFHIFETDIKYDMIIGQDLMRQLGVKIDFETDEVQCVVIAILTSSSRHIFDTWAEQSHGI